MKLRLVPFLACPFTRAPLRPVAFRTTIERGPDGDELPDIDQGVLIAGPGFVYPIIDGVPRLIEGALWLYPSFRERWAADLQPILESHPGATDPPSGTFRRLMLPTLRRFEKEWASHNLEDRTWGLNQGTRVAHFLRYVGLPASEMRGKWLLDAGAGTGQLTCSYASLGCEAVGVDLSPALARMWRLRTERAGGAATRVHLVQGDLMRPPFREASFDVIHSSGVMHHTPDTRKAFAETSRLARNGGTLAVWLYRETPDWSLPLVPGLRASSLSVSITRLRRFTTRMPPGLLHRLLCGYASAFQAAYKVNQCLRGRRHDQTVRERVTSLFDTLAPPFVWKHSPSEVAAWFAEEGYRDVSDTSLPGETIGFNIRGVRAAGISAPSPAMELSV